MVWLDAAGEGRMRVAYFRKDIELAEAPREAVLNLFADARYTLIVNGTTIGTGPVRFYPENPFYDRYDLRTYLTKGRNTIAVKVLSPGMHTFQTPRSIGGFFGLGRHYRSQRPAEIARRTRGMALSPGGGLRRAGSQDDLRAGEAWRYSTPAAMSRVGISPGIFFV